MPRLTIAVLPLAIIAGPTLAADGLPDDYCKNLLNPGDNTVWIVDNDVNDRIAGPELGQNPLGLNNLEFDNADAEFFVDYLLQNMSRQSRARVRARVVRNSGECTVDDFDPIPCVVAMTNAEDPDGCGQSTGFLGLGGCGVGIGCHVVICQSNLNAGDYVDGDLWVALAHEVGHAVGLAHTDDTPSSPTQCIQLNNPRPFCATSDGCDGELMCSTLPCQQSQFLTEGDADGLRSTFSGSSFSRRVYFDRDDIGSLTAPTWVAASPMRTAAYAPRIDCADSTTPTNKCAAVLATRTQSASNISVIRLNGPSGGTWSTQTLVATLAVSVSKAPDIAVNVSGTRAYVARVTDDGSAYVTVVPLDGSATTTVILAPRPVLPPRVTYAAKGALVLSLRELPLLGEGYGAPRWSLTRVSMYGTTVTPVDFVAAPGGIDLDGGTFTPSHVALTDYDFDCKSQSAGQTQCTIVAQFAQDDSDRVIARTRSIRFSVDWTTPTVATLLDADWDHGSHDANGVLGVALTSDSLFVSHSRPLSNGTDTSNTRLLHLSGDRISSPLVNTIAHPSDAESCASTPAFGYSMPAASVHGGYSFAFCPSCNPTPTLESISWGRRSDGDDFCF